MHDFLVSAYKSQDFAQSQETLAWMHDGETVTLRNFDRHNKLCPAVRQVWFRWHWWPGRFPYRMQENQIIETYIAD